MSTKLNKKYIWLGTGASLVVLIAIVLGLRLYPLAMVGTSFVWNNEYEQHVAIAKGFESTLNKTQIFNQLIETKQKAQLVEDLNVSDIDSVYNAEHKFYKTGNEAEYNELVSNYFAGNVKLFERYVVVPQANDFLLRVKYNSDFAANNSAYNKAENILNRLKNGTSFEELAKNESDDKISGQLGGDLGFVKEGQIIPELEAAVKSSTSGEVRDRLVISRYGYHILFPVATSTKDGEKVWHVKHILIKTSGYETWVDGQQNNIGVRKFTSI